MLALKELTEEDDPAKECLYMPSAQQNQPWDLILKKEPETNFYS